MPLRQNAEENSQKMVCDTVGSESCLYLSVCRFIIHKHNFLGGKTREGAKSGAERPERMKRGDSLL